VVDMAVDIKLPPYNRARLTMHPAGSPESESNRARVVSQRSTMNI
jgi:hypothetical protein